ncbi:hypothetical protein [Wolbachia endosymbiont (group A) of Pogonocherus hispidulus]|uniref:hypothetical protein n=1 Tax=Wolbachia endosymbiont (group A) of Pogonocherus hispidulus TaxID=3066136 RepID=UPI003340C013
MHLKAAKLQRLRLKKRQILKIDNDQGFFCLFFRLVNFLIFMAKDCTNVAITKAFLLGGCHPSAPFFVIPVLDTGIQEFY